MEKPEDTFRMDDNNKAKSMFSPYSSADPSMNVPGLFSYRVCYLYVLFLSLTFSSETCIILLTLVSGSGTKKTIRVTLKVTLVLVTVNG